MKNRFNILLGSLVVIAMTQSAQAAALTWDVTGGNGATIDAGSGTWNTTAGNTVWSNAGSNVVWSQTNSTSATNSAIFGGADGTYAITVGTGVAASSLSFLNSGYTFSAASAQQVFLTASPSTVANSISIASGKTATIGTNVTVAQQNALVGGGGTLNISGTGAKLDSNGATNLNIVGGSTVNVMTGGTFNSNNATVIGRVEGNGTLEVNGGTVTVGTVMVLGNTGNAGTSADGKLRLTTGSTVTVSSTSGSTGLRFGSNTVAAFTNTGTVDLDGGTLSVAKIYEGTGGTTTSTVNFNGGTLKVVTGSTFGSTFMTGLDNANVKEGGAKIDTNNIATTIGQALVHGGVAATDGGLIKSGLGTLTLTGNNTYTGTTEVQVGTLSLGRAGGTLLDTASVNVNGGILDVANADAVGAVTLTSGTISGAGALTGSSYTLKSGTVSSQLAGSGVVLTKNTGGTVNLGGTQAYTGATNIDAGILNVTGSLASAVNVNAGGTLSGEGSTSSSLNFGPGTSYFNFDASTGTAFTAASVSLDPSALVLLSPSGSGSSLVLTNSAGFAGGIIPSGFAPSARGTLSLSNLNKDLNFAATAAASLKWKGTNGTNPTFWDAVVTVNWTNGGPPDRFYSNDSVTFDDTASSFNIAVQGASVSPGAVVFDNSANAYALSGGAVNGTTLTKTGSNTLTISNANTFSGGTTISLGTLQLGDGSAATGSLSGAILNNASLVTNFGSNNATVANDISGSGSLTQSGSGTVSLTGTNSYGTTLINAGTLQVGSGSTTGTLGSGAVTNDATLAFNRSDASTVSNTIGGTGAVTKLGGGSINLSSSNSYSGLTTVSAGGLIVSANNALGTTATGTNVSAGSSLGFSGVNYSTTEKITGSGVGTTVANSGALIAVQRGFIQAVSGNNTFAGNIEITATGVSRIGTQDGAQLTLAGSITRAAGVTGVQVLFRAGSSSGDFITLSNAGNSWDTDASIFTGAASGAAGVRLGVDNALPITQTITGASSNTAATTLDLNGYNQTLNGLINSPAGNASTLSISNSNTGQISTLTLHTLADKTAGAGVNATTIANGAGLVTVVKTGLFNQTFNSTHTYTGGTRIDAGTLTLGHATNTLADTGAIDINGGTLAISTKNDTVGAVTLTSGSITGTTGVLTGSSYAVKSGTVSAILGGSGIVLTKSTTGTVTLSGTNSYSGATTVSEGKLIIDGNISTSIATVGNNGTLGGAGTVGALTVNSGGTLAPGNSPGTLTFSGNLILDSGSISDFEINAFTSGNFDLALAALDGTQTVNFNGGTLNLLFQSGFNTAGTVKIFDFDAYSGSGFTNVIPTGLASGFTASFDASNGIVTVIPEPNAAALIGSFGLLALLRRRRG